MDKNQIQQAIYGNANLSPTFNNGGGGGGVTGPGMLSGNNPVNNNGDVGNDSNLGSWQSMLNPNNDLLKNLLYGDLRGMLSNEE
jgi:hypothetical protein